MGFFAKIVGFLAVVLAVASYYCLQQELVPIELSILINAPKDDVYSVVSDPEMLPRLHHTNVDVKVFDKYYTPEKWLRYELAINTSISHLGYNNVRVTWITDPQQLKVFNNFTAMHGLSTGFVNYTVSEEQGKTILEERSRIYGPWILTSFINSTALKKHDEILHNIKFLTENPDLLSRNTKSGK